MKKTLAPLIFAALVPNMTGLWSMPGDREILVYDRGDGKFAALFKPTSAEEPFVFAGDREDRGGKTILSGSTGDLVSGGCLMSAILLATGRLNRTASEFDGKIVIIHVVECKRKKSHTFSEMVKGKWSKKHV
jgi:hypothetical protein